MYGRLSVNAQLLSKVRPHPNPNPDPNPDPNSNQSSAKAPSVAPLPQHVPWSRVSSTSAATTREAAPQTGQSGTRISVVNLPMRSTTSCGVARVWSVPG